MAGYRLPGEFIVDGVYFREYHTKEILEGVKSMKLTPEDFLLVGLPRTGKHVSRTSPLLPCSGQ